MNCCRATVIQLSTQLIMGLVEQRLTQLYFNLDISNTSPRAVGCHSTLTYYRLKLEPH